MVCLQSMSLYSPITSHSNSPKANSTTGSSVSGARMAAWPACSWNGSALLSTKFNKESLNLRQYCGGSNRNRPRHYYCMMMKKTKIEFIQGSDELTIPDVNLTKSRDGSNGMAIFRFVQPSVFDSSNDVSDITGLYMTDEEGLLQTVDISAKFVNGKPYAIEAKYIMKTPRDWDRFIRFMDRYSKDNGLQFIKT